LITIDGLCIVIANLPISHFGMRSLNRSASGFTNTEMNRDMQYNTIEMATIVTRNDSLLTGAQRII
jgi:hypothetical protein